MEIWKDIPGYEGYYQASNKGNIRSLDRLVEDNGGFYKKKGRVLKKHLAKSGYELLILSVKGQQKHCKVHRLIALTFLEKEEGKNFVNHKDGNKSNNNVSNLEWVTPKENVKHSLHTLLNNNNGYKYKKEIIEDYTKNNMMLVELKKKYKCHNETLKNILKEAGIKIKPSSQQKSKINKKDAIALFEAGKSNKEIASLLEVDYSLICRYKRQWKNGEIIIYE